MAAQGGFARALNAAKRYREGDVEILDIVLVDLVKLGIAMRRVVFVDHQPVLRLLIGVHQPRCRHFPGHRRERRPGENNRRQNSGAEDRKICHGFLLAILVWRLALSFRFGDGTFGPPPEPPNNPSQAAVRLRPRRCPKMVKRLTSLSPHFNLAGSYGEWPSVMRPWHFEPLMRSFLIRSVRPN